MSEPRHIQHRPRIAIGPELPGYGSWEWIGQALLEMLAPEYDTVSFRDVPPSCDVVIIVKQGLDPAIIATASRHAAVVYCPIDYYGAARHIDADASTLCRCARILVHCHRLKKYFQSYARVECVDHHVRFFPREPVPYREEGYVLWAGVRSNLPHLAAWVNCHALPGELRVLTNLEGADEFAPPDSFGFDTSTNRVRIARWSGDRHVEWTAGARCALDIKGDDFRQRHKPPTKGVDFIASGLPLAMNGDSSSVEYLAGLGFEVASPENTARWLSRDYYEETRQFGALLRERLSFAAVGDRCRRIVADILAERRVSVPRPISAGAA